MKKTKLPLFFIRRELILALLFLIVPILLPVIQGEILSSISSYAYGSHIGLYLFSFSIMGYLMVVDGIVEKNKRYNIPLGILLVGVAYFPVNEWRYTHDAIATLFFIGNVIVVAFRTNLINKFIKIIFTLIIIIVITLYFLGVVSLFISESIGFFLMSAFMFIRFLDKK